jgi:hypothetical protein
MRCAQPSASITAPRTFVERRGTVERIRCIFQGLVALLVVDRIRLRPGPWRVDSLVSKTNSGRNRVVIIVKYIPDWLDSDSSRN